MAERRVSDVCDTQLLCGIDQAIGLVESLERRVLGLKSIDLGDYSSSARCHLIQELIERLTGICLAQRLRGTLGQTDVLGLSGLADLIKSGYRFLERCV